MATKYGIDAFIARAKSAAAHKATRNTLAAIAVLVIIYLVVNEYVL